MTSINLYINDLDLSAMKKYFVNHGRLTRYAKCDYFIKTSEDCRYIGFVEGGYSNYIVHNSSEQNDYITGFAFEGEVRGLLCKRSFLQNVRSDYCKSNVQRNF